MKLYFKNNNGMTLVEIIVVLSILGIIMIIVSKFGVDVLSNNRYAQDSLITIQDARVILRTISKELRSASISNIGSYTISQAGTSSITFFSDIENDGLKEQIRYFISSSTLKKGIIKPTGSPLTYNSANEIFSILAYNVKNTASSPLFEYYNSSYTGSGNALSQPVTVSQVRLVKVNLLLDVNPYKSPIPRSYTTQVNIRNLKDNL